MAGLGEVCSHVAALLFKAEMGVKMGLTTTSSTSRACQWNAAFRKEVAPATVVEIFQQIKGRRSNVIDTIQATGSTSIPSEDVLKELHSLVPNAAFFLTLPPMGDTMPAVSSTSEPFPQLLTEFSCESVTSFEQESANFLESYTVTEEQSTNLERATVRGTSLLVVFGTSIVLEESQRRKPMMPIP